MSDWTEATDPVPARRELTDAEKRARKVYLDDRRRRGLSTIRAQQAISAWFVAPDFDALED